MSGALTIEARARRRRRRTAAWTTVAGLAVLVGAAVVAWSWRSELPEPVASHWGAGDAPDGFSSLKAVLSVMLGVGSVLVLGFGAITLWFGHSSMTRRMGAATTLWSALFMAALTVGSLNLQRGLSDAGDADGIGGVLLVALLGPLVIAVVVAISVAGDERQPTTAPIDPGAPRATPTTAGPLTWTGTAASPTAIVLGLAAAVLVISVALLSQFWGLLVVVVLVVALSAATSSAVVRVDGSGVTIRSSLGWPRTRVPLDEIVRADVTDVRPLRDFGGWGWRVGRKGRVGIVLRRGEALLIERTGGRSVVVTVDGAATAAGLVNVLADRARPQSPDLR